MTRINTNAPLPYFLQPQIDTDEIAAAKPPQFTFYCYKGFLKMMCASICKSKFPALVLLAVCKFRFRIQGRQTILPAWYSPANFQMQSAERSRTSFHSADVSVTTYYPQ